MMTDNNTAVAAMYGAIDAAAMNAPRAKVAKVAVKGIGWAVVGGGVVIATAKLKGTADGMADTHNAIGDAVVAFARWAGSPRYTRLDYWCWDVVREIGRRTEDAQRELTRLARTAGDDAAYIGAGGHPFGERYVRAGRDADAAVDLVRQAWDKFRELENVVDADAPSSYAAVGFAMFRMVSAIRRRSAQ